MKKVQIAYLGVNSLFGKVATNLLKQSPSIQRLTFFDDGEAIRSFDQPTSAYYGTNSLFDAIKEVDIVVIGEEECCSRTVLEDHLEIIGPKILRYTKAIQEYSPNAIIVVATSPINVIFPLVSQLLGPDFKSRLLGTTSIDTIRASRIFSNLLDKSSNEVPGILPVVGGSSPWTRVPLFSCHTKRKLEVNHGIREKIIETMKVFDNPAFKELDTIERAYSAVRFIHSIISGMTRSTQVIDMAMLKTNQIPEVDFFSLPVVLGSKGIETSIRVPNLDPSETKMFDLATESLVTESLRARYLIEKWEREARIEVNEQMVASEKSSQRDVVRSLNDLSRSEKCNYASQRDKIQYKNSFDDSKNQKPSEETTDIPIKKWQWNRIDNLEKKYHGKHLEQKTQSEANTKNKCQTGRTVIKGGSKNKSKNKVPSHLSSRKNETSKQEVDNLNYMRKGTGDNKMSALRKNDNSEPKLPNRVNAAKPAETKQDVKSKKVNSYSQTKGDSLKEDKPIPKAKKVVRRRRYKRRRRVRKNTKALIDEKIKTKRKTGEQYPVALKIKSHREKVIQKHTKLGRNTSEGTVNKINEGTKLNFEKTTEAKKEAPLQNAPIDNDQDKNIGEITKKNYKIERANIESNNEEPKITFEDKKRHLIEKMNWKIKDDIDIVDDPIRQMNKDIIDRQNIIDGMSVRLNQEIRDIKNRQNISREVNSQNVEKRSQKLAEKLNENKNAPNEIQSDKTGPQFLKISADNEIESVDKKDNEIGLTIKDRLKWPVDDEHKQPDKVQNINVAKEIKRSNKNLEEEEQEMRKDGVKIETTTDKNNDVGKSAPIALTKEDSCVQHHSTKEASFNEREGEAIVLPKRELTNDGTERSEERNKLINREPSSTKNPMNEVIKREKINLASEKQTKAVQKVVNVFKINETQQKELVHRDTNRQSDKTNVSIPTRVQSTKKIDLNDANSSKSTWKNNLKVKSEPNLERKRVENRWMETIKANVKKVNERIETDSKRAKNRQIMSKEDLHKMIQTSNYNLKPKMNKKTIFEKNCSFPNLKKQKAKMEPEIENPWNRAQIDAKSDHSSTPGPIKQPERAKSPGKITKELISKKEKVKSDSKIGLNQTKIENREDYWDSKYFNKASEAFFKMFRDAVATPILSPTEPSPPPKVNVQKPLKNEKKATKFDTLDNLQRDKNRTKTIDKSDTASPENVHPKNRRQSDRRKGAKMKLSPIEETTEEIQRGFVQISPAQFSGVSKKQTSSVDSTQNDIPTLSKLLRNHEEKDASNIESLFKESSEIPITKPKTPESKNWVNKPEEAPKWRQRPSISTTSQGKGDVLNFTDFRVYPSAVDQASVLNRRRKDKRVNQKPVSEQTSAKFKVPIASKLIEQMRSPTNVVNLTDVKKTKLVNDDFEKPKRGDRIFGIFREMVAREIEGHRVSPKKPMSNFFKSSKPEKTVEKLDRKIHPTKSKTRKSIKKSEFRRKSKSKSAKIESKLCSDLNKNENSQQKVEVKPEALYNKKVCTGESAKKNPKKIVNYFNQRVATLFFDKSYEPNYSVRSYKKND